MATTSLEGERARENGLEGRWIVAVGHSEVEAGASEPGWMCIVESHEAEMTRECSLL